MAQIEAVRYLLQRCQLKLILFSGKSDPFVVFTLDGQKVFKSQTKKKTLHPQWNETFAVTVVSVPLRRQECPFADSPDSINFSLPVSLEISN
jgi:hypothetical protein